MPKYASRDQRTNVGAMGVPPPTESVVDRIKSPQERDNGLPIAPAARAIIVLRRDTLARLRITLAFAERRHLTIRDWSA